MRKVKLLPPFDSFKPGFTATLNLPRQVTYDAVMFKVTGTGVKLSDVERARIVINGKTVQEYYNGFKGINDLNGHYRRNVHSGIGPAGAFTENFEAYVEQSDVEADELRIFLHHRRPELISLEQQRLFALGTLGLSNASILLDVASDAPADIAIESRGILSETRQLGVITKVKHFPIQVGAGTNDYAQLLKGALIVGIHLDKAEGDITDLAISLDGVDWVEKCSTVDLAFIQAMHGRVPLVSKTGDEGNEVYAAGNQVHLDFIMENDWNQAMVSQVVNDLRMKITAETAGTVNMVVEYLDGLNGI